MGMKKPLLISLIIAVLIGAGIIYVAFSGDDARQNSSTQTASQNPQPPPQASPQATPQPSGGQSGPGTYQPYSAEAVTAATGTKVLFFHAPWCPQCRSLDTDITTKGAPTGVAIFKVDYDSNQALRQKYGVTIQTTFVKIDDNGNLVKKYVAYDTPTLSAVTKELL